MSRPPPTAKAATDQGAADAAVVQAAAQWRARMDNGLSAVDQAQLAAWLEADDRHAEVFGQMDDTWSLLDRATEIPLEELGVEERTIAAFAGPRERRLKGPAWWAGTLAAAAAIAVLGVVAWRTLILPKPEFAVTTSAAMGLVKRVNLPDGSTVRLNSGAAVQVEYTHAIRRIRLDQGEASFDVAKDSTRPFIVTTAGVDVSAVGTVFTVSSHSRAVEVLVSEGKVRVNDAARGESLIVPAGIQAHETNQPVLAAGEKVIIVVDAKSAPAPVVPTVVPAAEIVAALAWQERRLDFFESTPLSQIAAQFNRFNHHQIVIADATLGSQRFAGSFRADDPETFIQLIKTRPGVKVERKVGETVIRKAE